MCTEVFSDFLGPVNGDRLECMVTRHLCGVLLIHCWALLTSSAATGWHSLDIWSDND